MQELSDQQLVQGFRSGDETAFEELVLRYRNQVYNTILNILHDRDLAWDGAQEIFLKLYQKMDTYQGKCPVGAWIYRIALNHGLNMLRKRKRLREEVPLEESYMSVEVTNGPSQDMMKGEFKNEELSFAIEKLPKVQKSVIILRHFSELSFREIADVLGKSEDSVKSNHYYAIAKLRKKLKRGESS
ncbi:MAG: RNA polymerase sigma factor [Chlamydiae bacterium]|nr:RNA polymerase sigma factor [Chlamydiota bacterium]